MSAQPSFDQILREVIENILHEDSPYMPYDVAKEIAGDRMRAIARWLYKKAQEEGVVL